MSDRYKNEGFNTPEQKFEELRNKVSRLEKQNEILRNFLDNSACEFDLTATAAGTGYRHSSECLKCKLVKKIKDLE